MGLPSLSAPKGGGAVRSIGEKFSANAATGTASLSVPIATSPGRGGFDLGLSLSYDSGSGNGPFGVGWQCGTPAITRKTDKGLPRYLDDIESDVFIFSGAEDLVPVQEEQTRGEFRVVRYRPRVEGAFARIERWTRRDTGDIHWRTTTGTNVTSVYGRDREARISDPEDPRRVFSWLLEEARDDRGNVVRYTYKAEDAAGIDRGSASESNRFVDGELRATAQRYLKRIEYGNRAPDDTSRWLFEVVFDYGEHDEAAPIPEEARAWPVRRDAFSTYRPGFEVRTYRLCRRVLMFHRFDELGPEPYLVRSTDLEYEHRDHLSALLRITQAGYLRDDRTGTYERATLPPLDLAYVERKVHGDVRSLSPGALDGIPGGVDGAKARWVDLEGEGISGVLLANDRGWYYKANLGQGQLAPPALLRSLPVPAALGSGVQQLTDIDGDGRLELVQYTQPTSGYFTRTAEGDWTSFTAFQALPRINWSDPNLRFLDVDGDGLADVLVTEHEALVWYRSRGKDGFEPPLILAKPKDEERGAAVVFNDGTETIQLADMSGDGLVDIVRIRNGEVCYWPNLGRGQFGRKITMDESPWFAEGNQFDPRRVRLADLDGSGTIDVIYLGRDGVRFYFNESGNRLSAPVALDLPLPHSAASVSVVDLLGNGTACLVWSSPLAADGARPLVYVDVMGGQKPHLLARFTNGMGGETRLAYASSTTFYLKDSAEGQPWLTRLPFPVHLLERLERYDHVAGTRLVTRYRYHHGFYDGVDREYRGFAYVEQWDAETLGVNGGGLFPEVRGEGELRLPPVRTRTWFHTGAWLERERLERALARGYYGADTEAPRLIQPQLPARLSIAEEREAARALRGSMLRQEIYAEDGLPESAHPYSVTEHTHAVRLVQRDDVETRGEGHAHAVFFVHAHEDLVLYYERRPDDPRVQHQLTLEVDDFGNVLRSVALAYPRRKPLHPEQERLLATVSEATFINRDDEESWYRIGVPEGSATSELTGLPHGRIFTVEALRRLIVEASTIPFEAIASGRLERRALSRRRALYYRDDLRGPLPLGQIESHGLPYETYQQAFTPGLLASVFGDRVDEALLVDEAGYIYESGVWWAPSGRQFFEPAAFYQAVEAIDPFGNRSRVLHDVYGLLLVETQDALLNTITAGDREVGGTSTFGGNDYRVLAPRLLTDANLNRTATGFDALGMPTRSALMGKVGAGEGDTLEDPTTRFEYDIHRYVNSGGAQPVVIHSFAREQHGRANPRWQETYTYLDGSAREVMRKVQAEPGPVPLRSADGHLLRDADGAIRARFEANRWIGTGRTVFDNKGNPVKKYEPFFSDTSVYDDDRDLVEWGVTPILRYDALGRLVRTDLPNGAFQKIERGAWAEATWDENDTVLESAWFRDRGAPHPRGPEPRDEPSRRAAWLAAQHAGTPTRAHLDALGRAVVTEEDNKDPSGPYRIRVELDITGARRAVIDARGVRTVDGQVFDMLDRRLSTRSPDSGWALSLPDAVGQARRSWSARGFAKRFAYDELNRPTSVRVRVVDGRESVVSHVVYGELSEDAIARNLRMRPHRTYDGAGLVINERFDFKGNTTETSRRLTRNHRAAPDWSDATATRTPEEVEKDREALLETEVFTATSAYDALNRVTSSIGPDRTETRPTYNTANLLERLALRLCGAIEWTTFVEHVDYDARGQRTRAVHGNGVVSTYTYERETFRLLRVVTLRRDRVRLQDNRYQYDPIGNIVQITDGVSFGSTAMPGDGLYAYDALYRLVLAEGREHPGQQPSFTDAPSLALPHAHDLERLRRYRETYVYDPAGNIERVAHEPLNSRAAGWVRRYAYAPGTSQLVRTSGPTDRAGELSERYAYDASGNMIAMPHLREMRWDHTERLTQVDLAGGGDVYFVYDAAGVRVRKIHEHAGLVEERIYLGAFELYRMRVQGSADPRTERHTTRITDGRRCVALVETKVVDSETRDLRPTPRVRYQIESHLGSSVMEVDDQGQVISYEEYLPFGVTAFRAFGSDLDAGTTRYRYTGKERDEETGLYYYGARYYAAWLGRWTSVDPSLRTGEGNQRLDQPYVYVQNRPIVACDPDGRIIWVLVAAIVIVGTLTAASPANAPETAKTPTLPRISEAEFATHIAVTGASFAAGGGTTGALLKGGTSKALAWAFGGAVSGLGAPVDLFSHDAFRGQFSSPGTYAKTTGVGVGLGFGTGLLFGGASRLLFGPAPPPRLPIGNTGGELESGGSIIVDEGLTGSRTWQDFLPAARQRLADAYATYGGKGVYNMAGRVPASDLLGAEVFPNTLPERLAGELAVAESLGVKPISAGTAGFDEALNQGTVKFVVTESGELLVTPHTVEGVEISHAVLSGGKSVVAAGQADVASVGGEYFGIGITEHSGHFLPSEGSLDIARRAFASIGITFP